MEKHAFDRLRGGFTFEERISGVEQFFRASVLAPLLLVDGVYHLVFERRAAGIRQGGEVCFPGGRMDAADASPMETALRETWEEIGCGPDTVDVVGRLDTLLLSTGSMIHAYLGILSAPPDPLAIAGEEVASVFTVPLSLFVKNEPEVYDCKVLVHPYLIDGATGEKQVLLPTEELGLPAYYNEPWGGAVHKIYAYHTEHGLVWGLTARIIYELVGKLKEMERAAEPGGPGESDGKKD